MCEGQLHCLLDLLHLLLKATNISIALQRRLLNLQTNTQTGKLSSPLLVYTVLYRFLVFMI